MITTKCIQGYAPCPVDHQAARFEKCSGVDGVSVRIEVPSVLRRRPEPAGRAPALARESPLPVCVSPSSLWGGVGRNEKAPRSDLGVEPGSRVSLFTHGDGQNDQPPHNTVGSIHYASFTDRAFQSGGPVLGLEQKELKICDSP